MKVIERVRLPEALLLPPGAPLCATGGGCGVTLFEGNSGRLWLLAPAPRGGIKLATTGINLSDFLPANYRTEYDLCDFTNPRLVIGHNDNAYVLDLSTGRLVVRLQNFFHVFQSVCLTPDGNWLFGLNDSSLALYRLNHTASGEASPSVLLDVQAAGDNNDWLVMSVERDAKGAFPRALSRLRRAAEKFRSFRVVLDPHSAYRFDLLTKGYLELLDDPCSARVIGVPHQPDTYYLIVGCYGFAVVSTIAFSPDQSQLKLVGQVPRVLHGFVYDPVFVEPLVLYPRVFFRHGYGAGLKALDLVTGSWSSCPRSPEPERPPAYSTFRGLIAGRDGSALVQTVDGWLRWIIGTSVEMVCAADVTLLSEEPDGLWGIIRDDPATMLKWQIG